MKGTISADIQDAKNTLLNNPKEIYEHNTIVDLLRNDLSMIAKEVRVARFRYIEKIKTNTTPIYQTSSEICGKLKKNWRDSLGELLLKLIPAGSISGAPKVKTIQNIKEIESDERNFYTGVFGIYDGNTLDSGINIRYVEKRENLFFYRSGGGITFLSDVEKEYDEFLNKIYVPVV
jgi:para-aminobenzoate synthetase component 1